jgi:hypothetical protein
VAGWCANGGSVGGAVSAVVFWQDFCCLGGPSSDENGIEPHRESGRLQGLKVDAYLVSADTPACLESRHGQFELQREFSRGHSFAAR